MRNFIHFIILALTIFIFYELSPDNQVKPSGMYLPLSQGYPKIKANEVKVVIAGHSDIDYLYNYRHIGTVTVTVPYTKDLFDSESSAIEFAKKMIAKNGANLLEIDMVQGPRSWFNTNTEVVTIQARVLKG
tara:strand:- start:2782 stop:3174 length:393 start_codon:yes stop_codon:yes gene_type:complete